MAWYMRDANDTNSNDAYLPKTTAEKAGCWGAGAAVTTEPNLVFASTIKPGTSASPSQFVPYPAGGGGSAILDTVVAIETTATLSVPSV